MGRDNKAEEEIKEEIITFIDSVSQELADETVLSVVCDEDGVLLKIELPRMSEDDYQELESDLQNTIEEVLDDLNLKLKSLNIAFNTDLAQQLDETELGEDINYNDDSEYDYEDYDNDERQYVDENLSIHFIDEDEFEYAGDRYVLDSTDDREDDDYDLDNMDDLEEDEYIPDSRDQRDLVDFMSDAASRLCDNDIRRSMGAYDDY